jgi:hypothetical protein
MLQFRGSSITSDAGLPRDTQDAFVFADRYPELDGIAHGVSAAVWRNTVEH